MMNNNNTQSTQVASHRDITKNPFVRYQASTVDAMVQATLAIMTAPGTELQLIADKAIELTLLNDAKGVFAAGEEAGLEITSATTGIWVIEKLTGKTWKELNAPTPADKIANGVSGFLNKALSAVSKGAQSLADKTKR